MTRIHDLKIAPEHFETVKSGEVVLNYEPGEALAFLLDTC